ncbi:hypothetical protein C3B59_05780 [Cryobacterium zongtaii]|uniref:4'-phosphopantetheinyl transferase domain-containing protein n=1 Tax=Cryobacterium zongtaii TaxID=1259217 RepID=A0A2S3ZLD8_9MICO|nr:4'-phosphopantetheinyl transferase superfamily protein [Cryobacterium zongtaii]POH69147.1 hypothetical protein C3B59_05780 [Cryobacterium zongtaii]
MQRTTRAPRLTRNGWHCSVTHSHQLVGVAISNRGPIGLDVEHVRDITVDDMRGALTHSELAHVRRQHPDDRVGEVFRSWGRKESIVKLTGEGVAAMPAYEVTTRSDNGFWTVQDASQGDTNYVVRDLSVHTGYVAAIAEYTPME